MYYKDADGWLGAAHYVLISKRQMIHVPLQTLVSALVLFVTTRGFALKFVIQGRPDCWTLSTAIDAFR